MDSSCIYLDYAATTPVDQRVIDVMVECLGVSGNFGNPASSSHGFGQEARTTVEYARSQVAELIGASPSQIVWTSGATESNNLAIKGVIETQRLSQPNRSLHLISSAVEHKAVLDTLHHAETLGASVTLLRPDSQGVISVAAVSAALRADTVLVSLMLVNNEIGSITDVAAIGAVVRAHGALMHVDAAQATGKLPIDVATWPVDIMSLSAHKTYGPKGIGALYVGPRAAGQLRAQMHGGGHEQGLRSGTLATHQIAGMGKAYAIARQMLESETQRVRQLRELFLVQLSDLSGITLNAQGGPCVPHTLSLKFSDPAFDSEYLNGILAISTTSACNSAANKPSHVLMGIGLSAEEASRTLRISFGRYTTSEDVVRAAQAIREVLETLAE